MSNNSPVPLNPDKFYQHFNANFALLETVLSSNAKVFPLECQDARKLINWIQLDIALSNAENTFIAYQAAFQNQETGVVFSMQPSIGASISQVQAVLNSMLDNPFLLPEMTPFLRALNAEIEPLQVAYELKLGGILALEVVTPVAAAIELYILVTSLILDELPALVDGELDGTINAATSAVIAYQDAVAASSGGLVALQETMVSNLKAMQIEVSVLLTLVEGKSHFSQLLVAVNDAPVKLLNDIANGIDFTADMNNLLRNLNILETRIDKDLNSNILDFVINECLSGVITELAVD